MSDYTVRIEAPLAGEWVALANVPAIQFTPLRWGWSSVGGPRTATIELTGSEQATEMVEDWLWHRISIFNVYGEMTWFGYIHSAITNYGTYEKRLSLENVYNKIQVLYTVEGSDQDDERTAWAEDATSQRRYGVREFRYSAADITDSAATQLSSQLLDDLKEPNQVWSPAQAGGTTGRLECRGFFEKLDTYYYSQPEGREVHMEAGGNTNVLGVTVTNNYIAFTGGDNRSAFGVGEGTHGFQVGNKIEIFNSTGTLNDKVRSIKAAYSQDTVTYTNTTISFATPNDAADSAAGFGVFEDGDYIIITGSSGATNDVVSQIDDLTATDLEIADDFFTTQAAGPSVTIRKRGYFQCNEPFFAQPPGSTVTIKAWGQKLAQQFTLENNTDDWDAHEVWVRISKTGSPTDNVRISFEADSAGEPSGTPLSSAQIVGSTLGEEQGWFEWTFSGQTLSYGTTYWLVVDRTGTSDSTNYYSISMDEDKLYDRGPMLVHDDTSWQVRPIDAHMPFQIWGQKATTLQMKQLIETYTDIFTTGYIHNASSVNTRTYKDGEATALRELEDLLELGTSANKRMMIRMHPPNSLGKVPVFIYAEPDEDDLSYHVDGYGSVFRFTGEPVHGTDISGAWVAIKPGRSTDTPDRKMFADKVTFEARSNRYDIRSEAAIDPYELANRLKG